MSASRVVPILGHGAAAKVTMRPAIDIRATEPSELILVDVPLVFELVGAWTGAR
jgi:hypothetical protein